MAGNPSPRHELAEALRQGLRRSSGTLRIAGWTLIALGAIAIIAPEVATLLVTGFIAWLLVFNAVAHFYLAFQVHGTWRIAGRSWSASSLLWPAWRSCPIHWRRPRR